MKIAVRRGHTTKSPGASGLIDENTEAGKVTVAVKKYLEELGQTVEDVQPSETLTSPEEVHAGVALANDSGAELFVSIHFNNAYDEYEGAIGNEVCVYSEFDTAQRVCDKLDGLGFKHRGQNVKPGLIELYSTNMKAMIVEVCFVEATEDVKLYEKLGADAIGKAIAEGIVNKTV